MLQAELDISELKYSVQQRDEALKVNNVVQEQLRDHIKNLRGKMALQFKSRDSAEQKVTEYELEDGTKTIALQHQKIEQKPQSVYHEQARSQP